MSREWHSYLDDILECCQRVRDYTLGMDQTGLAGNKLVYDAVLETWRSLAKHQSIFLQRFINDFRILNGLE